MKIINLLIVTVSLLFSAVASAHTGMQSTFPKNGAVITQVLETIDLNFSGPVKLLKLEAKGSDGGLVALEIPTEVESTNKYKIPLADLKNSTYKVNWTYMGADGHKLKGGFSFKYVGGSTSTGGDDDETSEVNSYSISGWVAAIVLNKLLIYIALAMTVGGLAAMFTVSRYKDRELPFNKYLPIGFLLGLMAVSLGFFLQVGSFAEEGLSGMWNVDYAKILWNSGAGKSYKFQLLGWCLVASTMIMMWIKPVYSPVFAALGLICVLMIATSFTLTGHTAEAPIWVRGALALHVVAAMWWMGSLYPLRSACDVLGVSSLQSLMVEFGKQAMLLVGLLIIAGGIISYHLEGSFSNLLDTGHGNLLLLKLGTVAIILSIAAVHKFRLVPKLSSPKSIATLKRSITIEIGIGFIILVITALMSSATGPAYG